MFIKINTLTSIFREFSSQVQKTTLQNSFFQNTYLCKRFFDRCFLSLNKVGKRKLKNEYILQKYMKYNKIIKKGKKE